MKNTKSGRKELVNIGGLEVLIVVAAIMGGLFIFISLASHLYGLNSIRNKTVGQGQHGTARWATKKEIKETYNHIPYEPDKWRTDEKTITFYNNEYMIFTVPIVLLITMKYSLDIEGESDGDPVEVLLHDKVLLTMCVLYLSVMFLILYL